MKGCGRVSKLILLMIFMMLAFSVSAAPQKNLPNDRIESKKFHYFVKNTPQWVKHYDYIVPTPNETDTANYRLLLNDDQVSYTGKKHAYVHRALMPLQKSALERVAQIEIEFNQEYQTLTLHDISVHRNGERINKLNRSKINLIQREKNLERLVYNGVVSASIVLEDVRVGDVVEYAYSIQGSNPIFGEKINSAFPLDGWTVPVEQLHIRLLIPVGRKSSVKVHGMELEPQVYEKDSVKEMIWDRVQIKETVYEDQYPRWYQPYPWLEIGEYSNWVEVAEWAKPMYQVPNKLSPELQAQIEIWRTLPGGQQEAALNALNFVQQEIRYFGVEIGTSSHRPSHPDKVFKQRYGDCKDKTLLLVTILNQLGIRAYPALVSARFARGISVYLPTPHAFDHIIAKAEINGKTWWLDGTNNYQSGDFDNRGYDDFGVALVIGDDSSDLTEMSVPDNSERRIEEIYTINEVDQAVTLVVTERNSGMAANGSRYAYGNYNAEQLADSRYNLYAKIFPNIQRIGKVQVVDDIKNNVFTIAESFTVERFFKRDSGRWKAEISAMALYDYLEYPKVIKRKSPLGLNPAIHVSYFATVKFANLPSNLAGESQMFASDYLQFVTSAKFEGKQAILRADLDFLRDFVPPSEVADFVEQEKQIRRYLSFSFSFSDRSTTVWSDNASCQALLRASGMGDLVAMNHQLAAGTSVNVRNERDITPLTAAILGNKTEAVRFLLDKEAAINTRTKDGWTPLLIATLHGAEDIVSILLQAGADTKITINGQTALMLAAEMGHDKVIQLLLEHGADINVRNSERNNFTALTYSAMKGHAVSTKILLEKKASMDARSGVVTIDLQDPSIQLALMSGDWPTVEILLKNGDVIAGLQNTIFTMNTESVKMNAESMAALLRSNRIDTLVAGIRYGLDVNIQASNGFTPLMLARASGNRMAIRTLLEYGARYREVGKDGWTSLMSAIEHLDTDQVKNLIAAGADVQTTDAYGISALTLASSFGLSEIAELIIKKGADLNQVDKGGHKTPLMYAVENGNKKMVELLINNSADLNSRDINNSSALTRTFSMEKVELYDALVAAGAKQDFTHPAHREAAQ